MGVVLARVDDRLIHGQVTVGYCQKLRPSRILLANNAIAADEWQTQVYGSSVPPNIGVSILSIAESVSFLKGPLGRKERILLLTGSLFEMSEVVRLGAPVERVNVGGLHFAAGKRKLLPFVYVDEMDLRALHKLDRLGVALAAQQVPGGKEYVLSRELMQGLEVEFS
jgi:mannose/fructose/N-acetylgalactosamine-specific phosphotransferase system component IIB